MATRINNPAIQHFDKDTGSPLSGGQLFFFEITSTTPKDTFIDEEGTIPNTNPVILDAIGLEPDIFGEGSYRVVLQNATDVQQWERDPVNFESGGAQIPDWLATVDYGDNDTVQGSDSFIYTSIQTPNLNNDPTTSPSFWTQYDLLKRWNTNEIYLIGDPVTDEDSFYISKTNINQGNKPLADATNWTRSTQFRGAKIYAANNQTQVIGPLPAQEVSIWDTAEFDTDNMFDFATNPERLTVPAGVTKVQVQATQLFAGGGATTGLITFSLVKNGLTNPVGPAPDASIAGIAFDLVNVPVALDTGIVTVVAGDFYSLFVVDGTDGAPVALFGNVPFVGRSFIQMVIIE